MWNIIDQIAQVVILSFSGATIFLLSSESRVRRKQGYIVGILGEPGWIVTTLMNGQWGVFLLSLWYTFNFIRGLKKLLNKEKEVKNG